jgi:hypothetical protein
LQVHACLAQNKQLTAMLAEQAAWPTESERRMDGGEGAGAGEAAERSPAGATVSTRELLEAKAEAARLQQRVEELSQQFTTANAKCGELLQVCSRLRHRSQLPFCPPSASSAATT